VLVLGDVNRARGQAPGHVLVGAVAGHATPAAWAMASAGSLLGAVARCNLRSRRQWQRAQWIPLRGLSEEARLVDGVIRSIQPGDLGRWA